MTGLAVGDTVNMDDAFGNHWVGGLITAVRPEGFYVRWPDLVIGVFSHQYAHYLKKAAS